MTLPRIFEPVVVEERVLAGFTQNVGGPGRPCRGDHAAEDVRFAAEDVSTAQCVRSRNESDVVNTLGNGQHDIRDDCEATHACYGLVQNRRLAREPLERLAVEARAVVAASEHPDESTVAHKTCGSAQRRGSISAGGAGGRRRISSTAPTDNGSACHAAIVPTS